MAIDLGHTSECAQHIGIAGRTRQREHLDRALPPGETRGHHGTGSEQPTRVRIEAARSVRTALWLVRVGDEAGCQRAAQMDVTLVRADRVRPLPVRPLLDRALLDRALFERGVAPVLFSDTGPDRTPGPEE